MPKPHLASNDESQARPRHAHPASPLSFLDHLHAAARSRLDGDDEVLDDFLRRIGHRVRQFMAARVASVPGSADVVDDLVQEALWKVIGGLTSCRATSDLQAWAWIWTVVGRVRIDYLRRVQNQRHAVSIAKVIGRLDACATVDLEDADMAPEDWVLLACLMRSCDELPPSSAALVWGRVILSMSDAEAGRELGTSASAVKRRWQRLQARLRRETCARLAELPDVAARRLGLAALRARRMGRSMAQVDVVSLDE